MHPIVVGYSVYMYLFNGKLHRWQQKAQDWLHDIATEVNAEDGLREQLANSDFTP